MFFYQGSANLAAACREINGRGTPFILSIGGSLHIVINCKVFLKVNTSSEALLALMASYYVFDLSYSNVVTPALMFLQSTLLGKPHDPSCSSVSNFIKLVAIENNKSKALQ